MARTFPPDVVILDTDGLLHARLGRGKSSPRIISAKTYRLAAGTFTPAVVTPELTNEASLTEGLKRLRAETGRWDKLSLLLPDSWFRINIVDLPQFSDRNNGNAMEVVRWSLKRTLPIGPELLRVTYDVLSRDGQKAKVLVLSAVDKTLAAIERAFAAIGVEVVLVEPVGLNIWNAMAVREAETTNHRLFVYLRDSDFTTAVFRGAQPVFIRSRNLSPERTLVQELRLSATYLRDTMNGNGIATTYLAGNRIDDDVRSVLSSEFNAPVKVIALQDVAEEIPSSAAGLEAELTACTGVFTG
ncbi:MAG TPA: hypothetical protein VFN10_04730 [Thermoanaerobaculia bacterium]|nr:hypothetical protein [Thermoanaerobaculia bacterium]